MKKVLFTSLQFLLFIMTFAVGSFMVPFKIQSNLDHSTHLAVTHYFIWDGLVLMYSLFIAILLIETIRRRFAAAAPWTTLATGLRSL